MLGFDELEFSVKAKRRGSKNFKIYLEGTRKRELVQKDVRFLGFESFL